MDGFVFKEVDGLWLKLHYCTPGLVRAIAESTPYKSVTSPTPLEPYLLLLLLLLFKIGHKSAFYLLESVVFVQPR